MAHEKKRKKNESVKKSRFADVSIKKLLQNITIDSFGWVNDEKNERTIHMHCIQMMQLCDTNV